MNLMSAPMYCTCERSIACSTPITRVGAPGAPGWTMGGRASTAVPPAVRHAANETSAGSRATTRIRSMCAHRTRAADRRSGFARKEFMRFAPRAFIEWMVSSVTQARNSRANGTSFASTDVYASPRNRWCGIPDRCLRMRADDASHVGAEAGGSDVRSVSNRPAAIHRSDPAISQAGGASSGKYAGESDADDRRRYRRADAAERSGRRAANEAASERPSGRAVHAQHHRRVPASDRGRLRFAETGSAARRHGRAADHSGADADGADQPASRGAADSAAADGAAAAAAQAARVRLHRSHA